MPKSKIDSLWEDGVEHEEGSELLLKQLKALDRREGGNMYDTFETGGDGDTGETIMFYLDVLIRENLIRIEEP